MYFGSVYFGCSSDDFKPLASVLLLGYSNRRLAVRVINSRDAYSTCCLEMIASFVLFFFVSSHINSCISVLLSVFYSAFGINGFPYNRKKNVVGR